MGDMCSITTALRLINKLFLRLRFQLFYLINSRLFSMFVSELNSYEQEIFYKPNEKIDVAREPSANNPQLGMT